MQCINTAICRRVSLGKSMRMSWKKMLGKLNQCMTVMRWKVVMWLNLHCKSWSHQHMWWIMTNQQVWSPHRWQWCVWIQP